MAYLVFTANGQEFDRRELVDGAVIGRALDCAISIHDILLSRHHCRVEKSSDGWDVVDLKSRNGTMLVGRQVKRHTLHQGDRLRIGRTYVTFHDGPFVPAPPGTPKRASTRPADPHEALAGTISGFQLLEPDEVQRPVGMPFPKPHPKEPNSFRDDNVYKMLDELMSSSWDSVMTETSRPLVMQRVAPRPLLTMPQRVRSKPRVAMCLQAPHVEPRRPRRLRSLAVFACSAMITLLIVGGWTMTTTQRITPVVAAEPAVQSPPPLVETPPVQLASQKVNEAPAEPTQLELILRLAAPLVLTH